jgi:hypothetical protein
MIFLKHSFNSLPAKAEHIEKVIFALSTLVVATEKQITQESGLTKTQTICVLNDLMNKDLVQFDKKSKKFNLKKVSQN